MSDEQPDKTIVQGVKYLKRAFGLLERLAPAGAERDTAGNRELLFSHYTGLVLLSFFNPAMQSLRGLVDLSHLKKVQRQLGNQSTSTGSLSESPRVFDPDLMVPIIEELIGQVVIIENRREEDSEMRNNPASGRIGNDRRPGRGSLGYRATRPALLSKRKLNRGKTIFETPSIHIRSRPLSRVAHDRMIVARGKGREHRHGKAASQ